MAITKSEVDVIYQQHKSQFGGDPEDYFPLLYLTRQFEKQPSQLARQTLFGEEAPEGINAFHVDVNRRNLYLFQFQWTTDHQSFKEPLRRLARVGLDRIFGPTPENPGRLLTELRDRLFEDECAIDKVLIQFVYNGDPSEADKSVVLDALREDLEMKKHLIDKYFEGRNITLTFQFISNASLGPRIGNHMRTTLRYEIGMESVLTSTAEQGERLYVGFIKMVDLYRMYREMGHRLFERNIRAGLDPDGPVNKRIRAALADVVEGRSPASSFVFNHNGVTIAAEHLDVVDGFIHITEPRVLNGAQTITSLAKLVEAYDLSEEHSGESARLEAVQVLTKIITHGDDPFITAVTINTNRQNPVDPINLRASDYIQLELQDKFRTELGGLLYERQEKMFEALGDLEMLEQGFDPNQTRFIEIKWLARTFLAAQGEIDRMSRLNDVFENENQYRSCFTEKLLKSDSRRILLAYKIHFSLNMLAREIAGSAKKYYFVPRAKYLLWALMIQCVLNHPSLPEWIEAYGTTLRNEVDFRKLMLGLGMSKVKHVMRVAVSDPKYQTQLNEEKFSFLRTKALYSRCMEIAKEREGWSRQWV
jgi:hypothetical protein